VGNFQVIVHFTLEIYDKAQFNWNFRPCLQDVHQNDFPFQDFVRVFTMLIEQNRIEYKKTGDSSDPCTLNILFSSSSPVLMFMHLAALHFKKCSVSCYQMLSD